MSVYLFNSRSEVNILLCGDPGTSKSQLLQVGIEQRVHSERQNFSPFLVSPLFHSGSVQEVQHKITPALMLRDYPVQL